MGLRGPPRVRRGCDRAPWKPEFKGPHPRPKGSDVMGFGQVIDNGRTTESWRVAYTQTIRVRYGEVDQQGCQKGLVEDHPGGFRVEIPRPDRVSIRKRSLKVRPEEIRPEEVRPEEVRPLEVRPDEIRQLKVC